MNTQAGFQKFKEWKRKLMHSRGLELPDGRSLYQYRLTTAEFDELETLLRRWLGMLSAVDLGTITLVSGFPELFVLYASEWWRRRYDGSGFSWEPMLRDLAVDPNGWTPGQRSDCVRDGLREWRLKPRKSGALRFLGAVAVQGGLPLRLLAEARGGVGKLLHRVVQLAEGGQVTATDVKAWVESLRLWLPKSYRQEAIYALLSDMVLVVLRLKQDAELTPGDDAISILNRKIPGWKERFPLSVEDKYARALVEQLVRDAASTRVRKIKPSLPVERFLERNLSGDWNLVSSIELPDTLETSSLARLFSLAEGDLPRAAQLGLRVGEKHFKTSIRRLAGHNCYRVESANWQLEGADAQKEHLLHMSVADGRTWSVEAHKGDMLEGELPWFFSADETPCSLLRQGSGNVAAAQVLLVLPEGWQVMASDGKELSEQIPLGELDRRVFHVRGAVRLTDPEGRVAHVRTGQASMKEGHLAWSGERLWMDFVNPSRAYRGMPRLYRVDDEGGKQAVNGRPLCSVLGASGSSREMGPVMLRYPANGEIKIRNRMLLLPTDANLISNPRNAAGGSLQFSNWGISSAKVLASSVQQRIQRTEKYLTLEVSVSAGVRAPEWLELELGWPHTTHPARLRVPFPASGVRLFDGDGQELPSGSRLAVQGLLGMRLVLSLAGQRKMELRIGTAQQRFTRYFKLRAVPSALSMEIPLLDYLTDIQQMLSMDDSPDSHALLSVRSNNQELFRLKVARYAVIMKRDQNNVYLEGEGLNLMEVDKLASLSVLATRLERPQDEPMVLEAKFSEGVSTGVWRFESQLREPGTWLIYPGGDAKVLFRACIWPVDGEIDVQDPLILAMSVSNHLHREKLIAQVIKAMAADYQHPSWVPLEQLAGQFGHLPLATLDLWRQFSHSFDGMVALALRMGNLPKGFFLRFSEELPYAWEVVPMRTWRQGIGQLKTQCEQQYGDVAEAVFFSYLDAQKQALWAECGALNYLLGLAGAKFDERTVQEVIGLKLVIAPTAKQVLFEGGESGLMALRRRHAEEDWPTAFTEIISQARKDLEINPFLCPESFGFQDGVINMPLMTAAIVAQGKSEQYFAEPQSIHLLRSFRGFDPDWFDDAYNLTIARCLAEGTCDE